MRAAEGSATFTTSMAPANATDMPVISADQCLCVVRQNTIQNHASLVINSVTSIFDSFGQIAEMNLCRYRIFSIVICVLYEHISSDKTVIYDEFKRNHIF